MKFILFADSVNDVVGVTGCVDDWEPEKELVVATMSLGYTLLVSEFEVDPGFLPETLAEGDRLFSKATTMAGDIERQLAYDVSDDETEQPW